MAGALQNTFLIGFENAVVCVSMILFEPVKERRPEVETDVRVVVYNSLFAVPRIVDDRKSVRSIALDMNALVPIRKGRRARLRFDNSSPRIFARWLIEMAVNYERGHGSIKPQATKRHKTLRQD